jgi:hypothetical protein
MARVGFVTFGILKAPYGSPVVQGFVDAVSDVFREATLSDGYITHAIRPEPQQPPFGQVYGDFGELILPRFYQGSTRADEMTQAVTLSLWGAINAVRRFAYGGLHKQALDQRSSWFLKPEWPTYAMWWVADDYVPSWREASQRLEYLHDNGPTPQAFNFGFAFDPDGRRISAASR